MCVNVLDDMRNGNLSKFFCFFFIIEENNFVDEVKNFIGIEVYRIVNKMYMILIKISLLIFNELNFYRIK